MLAVLKENFFLFLNGASTVLHILCPLNTLSHLSLVQPSVSAYSVINGGETEALVRTTWAHFIWAYSLLFLTLGFCGQPFFLVKFARNLSTLLFFSKTQFLGSFIYPSRFLLLSLHFVCSLIH